MTGARHRYECLDRELATALTEDDHAWLARMWKLGELGDPEVPAGQHGYFGWARVGADTSGFRIMTVNEIRAMEFVR